MRNKSRYFVIGIALYVIGSVITFGHSYGRVYDGCSESYASAEVCRVVESLFPAVLWPLYWSAQAWIPTKGGAE